MFITKLLENMITKNYLTTKNPVLVNGMAMSKKVIQKMSNIKTQKVRQPLPTEIILQQMFKIMNLDSKS